MVTFRLQLVMVRDGVVQYQDAADAGVDLSEDVAHHIQGGHQAELHGVIHHHADEHDVTRVLVEHSGTQTTTTTLQCNDVQKHLKKHPECTNLHCKKKLLTTNTTVQYHLPQLLFIFICTFHLYLLFLCILFCYTYKANCSVSIALAVLGFKTVLLKPEVLEFNTQLRTKLNVTAV